MLPLRQVMTQCLGNIFKKLKNLLNVLRQEQFKEAVIYPQWEIQLLSKNLKQAFQMMKEVLWVVR